MQNPFFELYVGDRISSEEFVTVFSPFLVKHAEAIFAPGNVVVTGIQGSGKSMLLSLLKPDVRIQYARARGKFPVPSRLQRFVGAGINLAHSNAIDFGYRRISHDEVETSILFGDFVNYSICGDLLTSIKRIYDQGIDAKEIGINLAESLQRDLVQALRIDPAWFGYLDTCNSIDTLLLRMKHRIAKYRRFLHMNDDGFDDEIRNTKTAIGVPVSNLVQTMKAVGVLDRDVNVFIQIDQYEELSNLDTVADGIDYRAVINRALARRDPLVSYRIGTRGHAWHNHGLIFGTTAKLEEERDYKFVNLDQKLRRHENRKTWIFPAFAADVFARRLYHADLETPSKNAKLLLGKIFGPGLSASQKAKRYGGKNPRRAVKVDEDWPSQVKNSLYSIADDDPLSARLGEAWFLQKGTKDGSLDQSEMPWEAKSAQWWKKERLEVALIQIAGRCQQRPFWCGQDEIVDLSGGNILTFLSICQFIWDTLIQVGERASQRQTPLTEIDVEIQAIGIFKASDYWLKKIAQETGQSGDRLRFVRNLGDRLSAILSSDRKLSNPGHNGFSVADHELEENRDLKAFLNELSDYGNLLQFTHTTKEKDRRSRQKWYLNPVLCPQFKLPFKRLKEPKYVRAADVREWLTNSGSRTRPSKDEAHARDEELPLFRGLREP